MKRSSLRKTSSPKAKSARKNKSTKPAEPKISRTLKPDNMELEEWQRLLRKQFAESQQFRLENLGEHPLFSTFKLTNSATDRSYRLAIRGVKPGENYCSCPDYRINNLGTCKHLEYAIATLLKRRGARTEFRKGYAPLYSEVYLRYGLKREVCFRAGENAPKKLLTLAARYFDGSGVLRDARLPDFQSFLDALPKQSVHEVRCYDDLLDFIAGHQDAAHRQQVIAGRLSDGEDQVMVGQSQLERFMESVEAATDNLPVQDKAQLRQEQAEEERETAVLESVTAGSEKAHAGEPPIANPLQELLKSGAQLLSGLSDALGSASTGADKTGNKPADMLARFIERDETTGKSHLKIPLPEPAVLQSVLSGLEKLFAAFGGGGKG